jgi:hypothetical protein
MRKRPKKEKGWETPFTNMKNLSYNLEIREHNKRFHTDLDKMIKQRPRGLLTFVLRVNAGNIVDVVFFGQNQKVKNEKSFLGVHKPKEPFIDSKNLFRKG